MNPRYFWRRVPAALIAFRFAFALVLALLSDVFDGIIARRANVAAAENLKT